MKKLRIFSFMVLLVVFLLAPLMALGAPPQDSSGKTPSQRALILTGMVSQKGAVLLSSADQKLYRILNAETMKHLEGQLVTLKARLLPEKGQLYVEAVRAQSPAPDETFRPGDAAFRR